MTRARKSVTLECPSCGFTTRALAGQDASHGPCPAAKGKRVALVAVESEAADA